ncbi:hydroxyacid dehydrogenase [Microbacterium sp. ZW T5_56]|uniref:hydroxyacid dehydrogenase n=1 Tax=Microbacterium sp. ZW T5_56 TaxID=3378081 RepID=UPI003855332E
MSAPRIIVAVPTPLVGEFFSTESWSRLEAAAAALAVADGADPEGALVRVDALAEVADPSQAQVYIPAWGAAAVDAETLARMPRLRLLAHSGASVHFLVTDALWDAGIRVSQTGAAMARPVAEVSLTFTLSLLHRVHRLDHAMHAGAGWEAAVQPGAQHEIGGCPITVVGASRTGRSYLSLLRALGAEPLLVDPTIDAAEAASLGARLVDLDEGMSAARIVALHAPSLPQTHHMIGARELRLMRDGAGLVNTARSWLVDEEALLAEVTTGRIDAAIDVFDQEPLPLDHPFRSLDNVLLTPHRAAGTVEGRLHQGRIVADEVEAYLADRPLQHTVTREQIATMA